MQEVAKHILAIDNFISEQECRDFIESSERKGYEESTVITESGTKRIENIRNNYRILFKDETLAKSLWEKLKDHAPAKIGNSVAIGLNEMFRFYRYENGQQFKKHVDESFIRNNEEASYYTFMIYLNDNYKGGETRFDDAEIKGQAGMGLIFLHSLPHEGTAVTEGVKYVLRTDIMYRLTD